MRMPRSRARDRVRDAERAPLQPGSARRYALSRTPSPTPRRSRDEKHRAGVRRGAWLAKTGTLFFVNVFVLVVIICNAATLLYTRAVSTRVVSRIVKPVTHAGYVATRAPADAMPAARALRVIPATPQKRVRMSARAAFDRVYAVAHHGCLAQWEQFSSRARNLAWIAVRWETASARDVRLADPPVRLDVTVAAGAADGKRGKRARLRRHVAFLDAHRRVWNDVVTRGLNHVLVIDDRLFLTGEMVRLMENVIEKADQGSRKRKKAWHVLLLRRLSLNVGKGEQIWIQGTPRLVRAVKDSVGVSAYVLSGTGARFLLRHVNVYRGTMDEEIARLQAQFRDKFVVLTVCKDARKDLCPGVTEDITVDRVRVKFPCMWRSLEERRLLAKITTGRPKLGHATQ